MDCAHHYDLPAGLAVADQTRLALGVGVTLDYFFDKARLRLAHILDRLTGHRIGQEANEIAGMASGERNSDFTVVFHSANPGPMPGARVKHDERPLARVDRGAFGRDDPDEPV